MSKITYKVLKHDGGWAYELARRDCARLIVEKDAGPAGPRAAPTTASRATSWVAL
jgi:hypothetical protein